MGKASLMKRSRELGIKGAYTIDFIFRKQVLNDKNVTYATFVCDYRPLK